jgi:hypothetical protein
MGLSGSCGCGAVQFEIAQAPESLTSCYCKTCQKLHSAPYATFARTSVSSITWNKRDTLRSRRFSTIASRTHCGSCGSQVYVEYFFQPHVISLSAALFDKDQDIPGVSELIYLKDKSPWDAGVINKGVDCYEAMPEPFLQKLKAWEALSKDGVEITWDK